MKEIVSVDEFRQYTGYMEEDPENLLNEYLRAAEDIVVDYLGYDPNLKDRDEWASGTGDYKLYLKAMPIETVYFIGYVEDPCKNVPINLCYEDNFITDATRSIKFKEGVGNIHVKYTAGFRKIPQVIKVAIMRIAALMLAEAGGNIGITGKAYGDQSRTFINYSGYSKYLKPLSIYRLVNFGV